MNTYLPTTRIRYLLVLMLVSSIYSNGQTPAAPGSNEPRDGGLEIQSTDLFTSGLDNVNIYRIPALLVAPSGTILAFCEARTGDDGDPTDLVLKRSVYRQPAQRKLNGYPRGFGYGVNWEPMRTVLPGNGQAVMNPTVILDRSNGRIHLLCFRVPGPLERHLRDPFEGAFLIMTTDDEGVTWSEPRDITRMTGRSTPGPGIGIQLQNGRLVVPIYSPMGSGKDTAAGVIYSDDHGLNWRAGAAIAGVSDEAQVVELEAGTVMINARSNRKQGCRYVAISRNGGESWDRQYDEPALPEPVCQASIIAHAAPSGSAPSHRYLIFANPAMPGTRNNLTIRVSKDLGKTWPVSRLLKPGPGAYCGLAVLRDGMLGVLYETGEKHPYEKITFARLPVESLLQ